MTGWLAEQAFDSGPVGYAADDGVPFPGWAPPALDGDEAAAGYEAGERVAVLAGDPADPVASLVLDRRNGRAVLTDVAAGRVVVLAGRGDGELTVVELRLAAGGTSGTDRCLIAVPHGRLRVIERAPGAPLWTHELLAAAPDSTAVAWPAFGGWAGFAGAVAQAASGWMELAPPVDADGWLIEVLAQDQVGERWRDLTRKHDAPRVAGTRPDVLEKLAAPRGWHAVGRRWRREDDGVGAGGATVRTDCAFSTGAGGAGEVTVGVEQDGVAVQLGLAAATARLETLARGGPGAPAYPRPSTGTQVAATAVLDLAGEVHEAVLAAVRDGAVPQGWASL